MSIWRTQLTREDWYFKDVAPSLLGACQLWEFRREKCLRENGGIWPASGLSPIANPELKTAVEERIELFSPLEEIKVEPIFAEDWKVPFLKSRYVRPKPEKDHVPYCRIEMEWFNFFRGYSETIKAIMGLKIAPSSALFSHPKHGEQVAAFSIDWTRDNKWLLSEFKKWLEANRPKVIFEEIFPFSKSKDKRGRGSRTWQIRTNLKSLAAVRLLDRHGHWQAAAQSSVEVSKYLGRNFLKRKEPWDKSGKLVDELLGAVSV